MTAKFGVFVPAIGVPVYLFATTDVAPGGVRSTGIALAPWIAAVVVAGRIRARRSLIRRGLLLLMLTLSSAHPGSAQALPKVVIASDSLPLIGAILRVQAESAGFVFQSQDRHGVRFTRNAGPQSLRGRMVPVTLEVLFHFEGANPGTRVIPTEELVATINQGIEERRRPNPKDRAVFYQGLLTETKRRVEAGTGASP